MTAPSKAERDEMRAHIALHLSLGGRSDQMPANIAVLHRLLDALDEADRRERAVRELCDHAAHGRIVTTLALMREIHRVAALDAALTPTTEKT